MPTTDYSRFICRMMAVQPDGSRAMTDVYYVFLEVPIALLSVKMPQPTLDRVFGTSIDEEGVETSNVTDVTLGELVLGYATSLNGTKAIIRLAAVSELGARYRRLIVSLADVIAWDEDMKVFGFVVQQWMDSIEYQTLLQTAEYTEVE